MLSKNLVRCIIAVFVITALSSSVWAQEQTEAILEAITEVADDDSGEKVIKDLEKRLKALETELKKTKDAETKRKEEDATKPSIKPRGRLHIDSNAYHQSTANRTEFGDIQDGSFFRRARLGFDAKAFEVTEYRLDFEMASAGGRPSIFDAYGRITQLPVIGNFQIGHFREPFSLEALTSSNWYTFMERGLNNTFDPSRNWGVMAFDCNEAETMTWALGAFREGSDNFGDDIGDAGERAITSRVSWLPFYDVGSEGRYFFEVGASYSYRDPDNRFLTVPGGPEESIVRYQGRPGNTNEDNIGTVPAFISASIPNATDVQLFGFESSWNLGAVNFQAEYIGSYVDRLGQDPVLFNGTYVQASYFLTGESRQWDRKLGFFGRAQVYEPFFRVRTKEGCTSTSRGAWELVTRWNYLDLSDQNINGGYMDGATVGLNWYLNSYMRMMFNYSIHDVHDFTAGRSDANTFGYRLDMHF